MNVIRMAFGGIVISLLCVLSGCEQQHAATPRVQQQPVYEGTIVAVGDSLTAGKGVNEEDAYPAQLESKLGKAGYHWRVVNAGISGETSSGTLSRVAWVLKLKPDIVILETGPNDGLRGIDPGMTQRNVDETVRILQENGVTVVLAGMKMVSNLGREFTRAFSAMYPAVARKRNLILVPFLLEGVAGDPSLNQADGIHPTAEGYRIVAETVYPYVRRAIENRKK
ncbi:MAG TPA: arylesterase [Nitrospirota bacterium]|nr:arylesterase [Nitrospirota bacterium]